MINGCVRQGGWGLWMWSFAGRMLIHSGRLNHYWAMNKSFVQSFQKFKELFFSKVCIVFVRQNEFSYWKMLSLSQIAILRGIPASWWNVLSSSTCQCKTVSLVLSECLPILMISFHYLEFIYSFQAFTFFHTKKKRPGRKISESRLEMEEKCKVREMHTKNSGAEPRGSALKSVYDRVELRFEWELIFYSMEPLLHDLKRWIVSCRKMGRMMVFKEVEGRSLHRLLQNANVCNLRRNFCCGIFECYNRAICEEWQCKWKLIDSKKKSKIVVRKFVLSLIDSKFKIVLQFFLCILITFQNENNNKKIN